ncbi:hypothetical protein H6F46_11995 [Limnothrix sp. FACHB-1083]|uniref:hypothetical protein n=1 Tax=unclassified Limnothrix TaxID=2632864 RepID=UPI001681221C|nr:MULTISPECIES: hypothetical protein [unclassified Limnothrix]MBD2161412.1 hypothetical protein [Limnothrix sp. FACHB-1083]MBD2192077.1 hypothetical protein [Limnothrix sp. FACHB-1088]
MFTKAAAARILQINAVQVIRVEEWANVVLVVVKGRGGRFVSKRDFARDFRAVRESGARNVRLTRLHKGVAYLETRDGNQYRHHAARIERGRAVCDCADWVTQSERGAMQPICKHLIRAGFELHAFRQLIAA